VGEHSGWFVSGKGAKGTSGHKSKGGAKSAAKQVKGGKVEGPLTGALKALFKKG
jgi:hypothetical protein